FHKCRGTPGTGKDVKFAAGGSEHLLDEGYPVILIVRDAEGLQFLIALGYICVGAAGKIATVNICPRQFIANAPLVIVIGGQNLPLFFCRQGRKHFRRRIRQCSPDAEKRLKLFGGIDKNADLRFLRLAHISKSERVSRRDSVIGLLSRGKDPDLSSLNGKWLRLARSLVLAFRFSRTVYERAWR